MGVLDWFRGFFGPSIDSLVRANLQRMSGFEDSDLFAALGNVFDSEKLDKAHIEFYYRRRTGEIVYFLPRQRANIRIRSEFEGDASLCFGSFDLFSEKTSYHIFDRYIPGKGFAYKVLNSSVKDFNKGLRYDQKIKVLEEKKKNQADR